MNKQKILEFARKDPRFQQGADILETQLSQMRVSPEMLGEIVDALEFALEHPDQYGKIRAEAIKAGFASEQNIPQRYDPKFIISMLLALYEMQDRLAKGSKAFAQGGLAKYGRGGDSVLAHINPMEAEVLRRMGGSGTANPHTGMREFKGGGLGNILSVVAPVAMDWIMPGAGSLLGSAFIGGAASAAGGGNFLTGAITGGLGAGLGDMVGGMAGEAVNSAFGSSLSAGATSMIGNALVGGVAGVASGQGFGQGLANGIVGSMAGNMVSGMAGDGTGAFATGIKQGGQAMGNMLTAGAPLQQAILGGGLAGLAAGLSQSYQKPSDTVLANKGATEMGGAGGMKVPGSTGLTDMGGGQGLQAGTTPGLAEMGGGQGLSAALPKVAPVPQTGGLASFGNSMMKAAPLLALLGSAQTPEQVMSLAPQMSKEQQEYFNKTAPRWDWSKIQTEAAAAGKGVGAYMAENWNKFTDGSGRYDKPTVAPTAPAKLAAGGLSMLAMGLGSGRDDTIEARLSDGEYVMDAETTALLGDGSVKEGAKRFDQMRSAIRVHKGKALARGKISPNAKSPLAYLKGVA